MNKELEQIKERIEKEGLSGAYTPILDILQKDKSPELRKKWETMKAALQSNKNDWRSLRDAYDVMREIIVANPELRKDVWEMMKSSLQMRHNNGADQVLEKKFKRLKGGKLVEIPETFNTQSDETVRCEACEAMIRMLKETPETKESTAFRADVWKVMKSNFPSNGYTKSEAYITVFDEAPELRKDVWQTMKADLLSDKGNKNYKFYYEAASKMFEKAPELRPDILKGMDAAIQVQSSWPNAKLCLICAEGALGDMFCVAPELRPDILKGMDAVLQVESSRPDAKSCLICAEYTLGKMFCVAPELRKDIWKMREKYDMKQGGYLLKMFEAAPEFRKEIWTAMEAQKVDSMGIDELGLVRIFKSTPEFRKDILDAMKARMQPDQAYGQQLNADYSADYKALDYKALGAMFKEAPELGKEIFEVYKTGVCSGKNDKKVSDIKHNEEGQGSAIYDAYPTLLKIVKRYPDLSKELKEMIKTAANDGDEFAKKFFGSKEAVLERVENIKKRKEAVSGVVVADEIAENKRKENSKPATPEMLKALKERYNKGKGK